MAKKPKPITVNKTQTTTYDLNKDAKTYNFGAKFLSEGTSTLTGIDTNATVTASKISFNGKINLTGAPTTGSVIGMDIDVTKASSITVGAKGSITATHTGIDAQSTGEAITLINNGAIIGTKSYGISAKNSTGLADGVDITNNKSVTGGLAGVALWDDGGSFTNSKTGTVAGTQVGVAATGTTAAIAAGAGIWIDGLNTYAQVVSGQTVIHINNAGTIAGAAGTIAGESIHAVDASVDLNNSGILTGSVSLGGGNDIVLNTGTLTGNLDTGEGNDSVKSTGTLTGDVTLGAGSDRFEGVLAAGKSVSGGLGDDTFVFGTAIGTIKEGVNEGSDTVVAGVAIDLSTTALANIENAVVSGTTDLNLTGSAADNMLIGNAGKNVVVAGAGNDTVNGGAGIDTITGGLGADILTGGTDADTFVFKAGDALLATFDTVTDFVTGTDKLSLGLVADGTVGATGNYVEATVIAVDFANATTHANTNLMALETTNGTAINHYALEQVGKDAWLFIDNNSDGTADDVIKLTGLDFNHFQASDIIL